MVSNFVDGLGIVWTKVKVKMITTFYITKFENFSLIFSSNDSLSQSEGSPPPCLTCLWSTLHSSCSWGTPACPRLSSSSAGWRSSAPASQLILLTWSIIPPLLQIPAITFSLNLSGHLSQFFSLTLSSVLEDQPIQSLCPPSLSAAPVTPSPATSCLPDGRAPTEEPAPRPLCRPYATLRLTLHSALLYTPPYATLRLTLHSALLYTPRRPANIPSSFQGLDTDTLHSIHPAVAPSVMVGLGWV